MHLRYRAAASPRQQGTDTMRTAYKFRLFRLDRWNLWQRLTRYSAWMGPDHEVLDGTHDATERAIGCRVGGSRSGTARCAATNGRNRSTTSAA